MKADRNEFTDRYVWTNDIWEGPEGMNNIRGISEREGCCGVNFFSHQPALNYGYYKITKPWQMSPEDPGPTATLNAMMDIMRFWLSMGCDGFRVDMAASLVKNDEDGKGTISLWKKVRAFLDNEFPGRLWCPSGANPINHWRAVSIWISFCTSVPLTTTTYSAAKIPISVKRAKEMPWNL